MNNINVQSNNSEYRLPYNYAKIRLDSGLCVGCKTYSSEIIHDTYIPVPHASDDYVGKYYNQQDGHWYADSAFSVPLPELDW